MLYWIQILPPIGGATSMDFFTTHIACLIAAEVRPVCLDILDAFSVTYEQENLNVF